jgi:hypothetical protein
MAENDVSRNTASMKIRRGAFRILAGKSEGKKYWRGLVANMKVSLQGKTFI